MFIYDYKDLISRILAPFITAIVIFIYRLILIINTSEVETLLISREKRILVSIRDNIYRILFILFLSIYFLFLMNYLNVIPSSKLPYVILITFFLGIMCLLLLLTGNQLFNKIKGKKALRITYQSLNYSMYILATILYSSMLLSILQLIHNKNTKVSENIDKHIGTILIILIFYLGTHYLYLHFSKYYEKSFYIFLTVKTTTDEKFENLYLHGHDDKNVYFRINQNHLEANEYIIINKGNISYYYVKKEHYLWDKNIIP